ncbi:hypothetical protein GIB67_016843, partial [Kingdonia uniflora]
IVVQNFGGKKYKFGGLSKENFGFKDCNQSLSVELNKKLVVLQSHQPVPDATLRKKYDDLLFAHEDVKKKLIAKENFVSHSK